MRNERANGAGTLLSGSEQVNGKVAAPLARPAKPPRKARLPRPARRLQPAPSEVLRVPTPAITLPLTLRFTCGQLAMLALCCKYDHKRTVGEWVMEQIQADVVCTVAHVCDIDEDEADAMWNGKEEA